MNRHIAALRHFNVYRKMAMHLLLCFSVISIIWAQPTVAADRCALLVGVNEYQSQALGPLKYTENDVTALKDVLDRAGYTQVVLMTETEGRTNSELQPRAENIRHALEAMLSSRKKGDLVLVAFSGHGVQLKGTKDAFFCPQDFDPGNLQTMISLAKTYDMLHKCKADSKVLLVDACRSEFQPSNSKSVQERELEPVGLGQIPVGGIEALFSCSSEQQSFEDGKLGNGVGHGVFFHFIIQGLMGMADLDGDSSLELSELYTYVARNVKEHGDSNRQPQTPARKGEHEGLLVLIPKIERAPPPKRPKENEPVAFNSIGMQFALIVSGAFNMGSSSQEHGRLLDEVQHQVQIVNNFYMGSFEVTQAQYHSVMRRNPSYFSSTGGGKERIKGLETDRLPVENVSWEDAKRFCEVLSERAAEKAAGRSYRLPTEAEWEYACRAGSNGAFSGTGGLSDVQANYNGTFPYLNDKPGKFLNATAVIGKRKANAWGLYDMHGNVWEWCSDGYGEYDVISPIDPLGALDATTRVARGGAWYFDAAGCRSAARMRVAPTYKGFDSGFRVVLMSTKNP